MKKLRVLGALLLCCTTLFGETILLTPPFYSVKDKKVTTKTNVESNQPVFYIIVPESYNLPSEKSQTVAEIEAFTKNVKVPRELLPNQKERTTPVVVFLDWKEQETLNSRKKAGEQLAKKIGNLQHRFKRAKFIVLSYGQGANVLNHASHSFRRPIDIAIQLSPPVFQEKDMKRNKAYQSFTPDQKMIKELYTFHSDHELCMLHPSLHPTYKHYYPLNAHGHQQDALLLINNDHPLPVDMFCPLVGTRILELCKRMKTTYPHHNHLVAHISTTKRTTDMMVLLRDGATTVKDKQYAALVNKERMFSSLQKKQFKKLWGRSLKVSLSRGEKSRRSYDSIKKLALQTKVS